MRKNKHHCQMHSVKVQESGVPSVRVLDGCVVHNLGCCTSGSPSSSGAVNTKTVASVPVSTLLTYVIKWSLASDVISYLVPMAYLLGGMSCSATAVWLGVQVPQSVKVYLWHFPVGHVFLKSLKVLLQFCQISLSSGLFTMFSGFLAI